MPGFERIASMRLGESKRGPRVYLQGKYLLRADFAPGRRIEATFEQGRVTLRLEPTGARTVSAKGDVPVIDVTGAQLARAFGRVRELQVKVAEGVIVITPTRTAAKVASRCRNGREGSLFSGGGLLSEAAKQAGYEPAFACEWEERFASIFEENHRGAKMFQCSIHEIPLEELPQVEVLTIGIPCEPFSVKRRNGAGGAALPPEAHELGDMTFWALRVIDHLNPATVVVEEAPGFLKSGAGCMLLTALRRMGYEVGTEVLDSTEHGALTVRRRAVIVATTGCAPVFPERRAATRTLAEVLETVPEEAWFDRTSKAWLFRHWEQQSAKGNGFAPRLGAGVVGPESTHVSAVSKRYFNEQGDGTVVAHPTRPDTYRWLTLTEVKAIQGVPADYFLGAARTTAGNVLGQGVVVSTFRQVFEVNRGGAREAGRCGLEGPQMTLGLGGGMVGRGACC